MWIVSKLGNFLPNFFEDGVGGNTEDALQHHANGSDEAGENIEEEELLEKQGCSSPSSPSSPSGRRASAGRDLFSPRAKELSHQLIDMCMNRREEVTESMRDVNSFEEFYMMMKGYCSKMTEKLAQQLFYILDKDGNCEIEETERGSFIRDMALIARLEQFFKTQDDIFYKPNIHTCMETLADFIFETFFTNLGTSGEVTIWMADGCGQMHLKVMRTELGSEKSARDHVLEVGSFPFFVAGIHSGDLLIRNADSLHAKNVPNKTGFKQLMYTAVFDNVKSRSPIAMIEVGGMNTSFTRNDLAFVRLLGREVITRCANHRAHAWHDRMRISPFKNWITFPPAASIGTLEKIILSDSKYVSGSGVEVTLWSFEEGQTTLLCFAPESSFFCDSYNIGEQPVFLSTLATNDAVVISHDYESIPDIENQEYLKTCEYKIAEFAFRGQRSRTMGFFSKKTAKRFGKERVLLPSRHSRSLTHILCFSSKNDKPLSSDMIAKCIHVGRNMLQQIQIALSLSAFWEGLITIRKQPALSTICKRIRQGEAVALVGAGFSVPLGLKNWKDLLEALRHDTESKQAQDGKNNNNKDIAESIEKNTAEGFDEAAQMLEDVLESDGMISRLSEHLKLPEHIPLAMVHRIQWLRYIPFRAILTTNYDMSLTGCTPACEESADAYAEALRPGGHFDPWNSLYHRHKQPIIKLHGCLEKGNIVFTREGYRGLLYNNPGYQLFIKSLFASRSLLSLGHSGADMYLNEIRSEVLTMYTRKGAKRKEVAHVKPFEPLLYSLQPSSEAKQAFGVRHDAIQYVSWDIAKEGFAGFDRLLRTIYLETNPRVRLGRVLRGRRTLVIQPSNPHTQSPVQPMNVKTGDLWSLESLHSVLVRCHASVVFDIVQTAVEAIEKVQEGVKRVAPYDLVLVIFDAKTSNTLAELTQHMSQYNASFGIVVIASEANKDTDVDIIGEGGFGWSFKRCVSLEETCRYIYDHFKNLRHLVKVQLGVEEFLNSW